MLAFTFPGQGSQKPGMGAPWVDHPSWELVVDASKAAGRDVAKLLLETDAEELTQTRNAQLATFVMSLVALDAIERLGIEPALVAGHSLGEYTALVASGAISFEEGCHVVVERGEAMQQAAEDQPGTMYAVLGLDDDQVDVACRKADGDAWVANYNAPGQVVIAGSKESLERAAAMAKEAGAKRAVQLPVGGAFHTPYMASARPRLRKALEASTFRNPEIPILANVDAKAHESGDEWTNLCSSQLCSPVRWRQTVDEMSRMGATVLIEVGPGNVLSGLAKRIAPDLTNMSISSPDDLDRLLELVTTMNQPPAPVPDTDNQGTRRAGERLVHEGEHLYMHERLIVSPFTGLFTPLDADAVVKPGDAVQVGAPVGRVGDNEIRTAFPGILMGTLAIPGERVTIGQPVAWLRMEDPKAQ